MFSLFSSFDYFWLLLPKLSNLLGLFSLFLCSFSASLKHKIFILMRSFFFSFFSSLSSLGFSKSVVYFLFTLLFFIFILNFSAVFPFVFAHSSQISLVLSFGFSIWLSFMIYFNFWNFKSFSSHCVPEGSPMILVPVLFAIEIVSNVIRPVTLTVRLVANILAGHLLLILLSKIIYFYFLAYPAYLLLNMVEFFVAIIQSYIFVTMVTLYYCDLN